MSRTNKFKTTGVETGRVVSNDPYKAPEQMPEKETPDPNIVILAKRFYEHQCFGQSLTNRFEHSHERVQAARHDLEDVLEVERTEQSEVAKAKEHWQIEDRALKNEIAKIVFPQPEDCCGNSPLTPQGLR